MGLFKRERCSKEETVIDMLASALDRHNLSEIEYGRYGIKLRLAKYNNASGSITPYQNQFSHNSNASDANEEASDRKAVAGDVVSNNSDVVTSPMVGVVYLSPSPSQPSYVKKGDGVKVGDTLCLIEAMKTFNPVKADKSGIIKEILVKEGQSVEYGEHLFVIE